MGNVEPVVADDASVGRYTLAVAVANPDHVEQLLRTAVDLAAGRDGEIRVVTVNHKPMTSPFALFSEGRIREEFSEGQQAVLDAARAATTDAPVPVECDLLVGTDVSDAILSAVEEMGADALLLGWQRRSRAAEVVLGTHVDPLVRRATCDVFVERVGTTAEEMDALLLPTDGGPHVEPAADLVGAIARANGARVRVVSYVPPDAGDEERATAREHVDAASQRLSGVAVDAEVCEAAAVADAIVAAAADHDLVALGATRERQLRGRVVGSVAAEVGRRVTVPVVIAKRGGERSFVRRALDPWW